MYKLVLNHNLSKSDFNEAQLTSQLIDEIENIECTSYLRMPMIKKSLINTFSNHGFVNKIRLHPKHKIYITGIKSKVGLCIQMGHKAGFYFDLYKLAYLKKQGLIDSAIIILPSKELEKFCKTSSLASYELISRQMSLFENINNFKMHLIRLDIHRRT